MTKIGGFFALDLPLGSPSLSVAELWKLSSRPHLAYANARSALNALLRCASGSRFWLPAYSCASLVEAAQGTGLAVRFYNVTKSFCPDLESFDQALRPLDIVLVIDYFGRPTTKLLQDYARSRPDVCWIEDRSQALDPSSDEWADYLLYSPRKLFGVPDGGLLISLGKPLPDGPVSRRSDVEFIKASLLRYEDKCEQANIVWYKANLAYESAMVVNQFPMSRVSQRLLAMLDARQMAEKRRDNFNYLMGSLADLALLPESDPSFAPLGFPIMTNVREVMAKRLADQGIFAAHHWPSLPSLRSNFPVVHDLADQMLTLPCDHRYDQQDMARVISAVRAAS